MKRLKHTVPLIGSLEKSALRNAIASGNIQGAGRIGREAENLLKKELKARNAFLTTSGTHALELALMALRIKKEDEVICPSFTFVSTANAIIRQGAKPVFAEIERSTLNIDIDDVIRRITKRTRAIIPVHYAGFSCDMERLKRIGSQYNIAIVEDAAQAIGAKYNGKRLGTFGDLGCISFHSTKNITCGEGGAVVVNRKNLEKTIQVMREKGTNRTMFLEGKISKYTWVDVGSSFVISDLLAAMLLAQLKRLAYITATRRMVYKRYAEGLAGLENKGLITLPHPDEKSFGNGHIFWFLLNKAFSRKRFLEELKKANIECTHHYVPLHSSPYGMKYLGYKKEDFPITEDVARRLVRLPVHSYLKARDISYIVDRIKRLLDNGAVYR